MVYDFSDVADVLKEALDMQDTLVRNWTLGKPLKIQGANSTLSRNLFSEEDVFKFGLLYELRRAGIETKELDKILKALPEDLERILWLTIIPNKQGFQVASGKKETKERVWITINLGELIRLLKKEINKVSEFRVRRAEGKNKKERA